jgi:tRNA-Thr(GGU) m(6)t(6)A37 methyltransferase TsaA
MTGFSSNYHILNSIGVIRSPYLQNAPYQPIDKDKGVFKIVLDKKYIKALKELESFTYIYVIYYLNKVQRSNKLTLSPPWANNVEIGVFASRSPNRPNPIGLSVVKIIKIVGNNIFISSIDAFDKTPLLDIKPYINKLDAKSDANFGWINEMDDENHLEQHIKGEPHSH